MSKRHTIIGAIKTRMQTIRTTNGYETDAGANVFDSQVTQLPESVLQSIILYDRDGGINAEYSTLKNYCRDLIVDIEVDTKGSDSREKTRSGIDDIWKAVKTDRRWGGLAIQTVLETEDMVLAQGDKLTGGSQTRLRITYAE